jgi:methylenetetrahydrofolate reductase (NADPH)
VSPSDPSTGIEPHAGSHVSPRNASHHNVELELVTNGSIEFSFGSREDILEAARILPFGTAVYVPAPRGSDPAAGLESIEALHSAQLLAVPHIAARNCASRNQLQRFLGTVVENHGVHRVLLIGGDQTQPKGPYTCSGDLLAEGILADSGIKEVALAGYPEGQWNIPGGSLQSNLERRIEAAEKKGLGVEIVTQFSFSLTRVAEYCIHLDQEFPEIPVYVGMAGPASERSLRHFANYCGVSSSLLGKGFKGLRASENVVHTDPQEQLSAVAHHCASRRSCNVIGIHLYGFGGFVETARWLQEKLRIS